MSGKARAVKETSEKQKAGVVTIDARGVHYRELNDMVRGFLDRGHKKIVIEGVNGQRYIGDGLQGDALIVVKGVPGNDLAVFMDGPTVVVEDNAQDCVANTMNSGKVVVKGHAGDVLGYGMRGGKLFVRGNVGYRVGIHMKGFKEQIPVIIAGGTAGDFFGEYMAGGVLVLLGIDSDKDDLVGDYLGTGMHGGVIYLRGEPQEHQLGKEVRVFSLDDEDRARLEGYLSEYCEDMEMDLEHVLSGDFIKLNPYTHRPYGKMYVY